MVESSPLYALVHEEDMGGANCALGRCCAGDESMGGRAGQRAGSRVRASG